MTRWSLLKFLRTRGPGLQACILSGKTDQKQLPWGSFRLLQNLLVQKEIGDVGSAVDHRTNQFFLWNDAVDDVALSFFMFFQGFLQGSLEFFCAGDAGAFQAVRICEFDKIRTAVERCLAVAFILHQFLPLGDHAHASVVEDNGDNRQVIMFLCGEFVAVHAE